MRICLHLMHNYPLKTLADASAIVDQCGSVTTKTFVSANKDRKQNSR